MTYLATLHEEILFREQEAYGILSDQLYSEGQIASLCRQADVILRDKEKTELLRVAQRTKEFSDFVKRTFERVPFDDVFSAYNTAQFTIKNRKKELFTEDEFYTVTLYATLASVHFRNLQKLLPPPDFGGASDDPPLCLVEFMAKIALDVSIATIYLTEAGWKPVEAVAKNYREGQKAKASTERHPELNEMFAKLASYPAFNWKHKELWPELISMMDEAGMDPQETGNPKNAKTWEVKYTTDKGEFPYKFTSFCTKISSLR